MIKWMGESIATGDIITIYDLDESIDRIQTVGGRNDLLVPKSRLSYSSKTYSSYISLYHHLDDVTSNCSWRKYFMFRCFLIMQKM